MLVVKAGGRALEANMEAILRSVAARASRGVVFVHGGGDIVSRYERAMGIEPKFVVSPQGIRSRLTTHEEMEVYNMVMSGKLNKEIVAALQKLGAKAVGLSGADGALLRAKRKKRIITMDERGRRRAIEGGYTGRIVEVNIGLLNTLTSMGYAVVVAPVALGSEGELLNVDADQAAACIASALKADELIILSDVEGVLVDNGVVRELKLQDIERIQPKIGAGMNRKLMMCAKAIEEGVGRVIICSGLTEDPIKAAESGHGTLITR